MAWGLALAILQIGVLRGGQERWRSVAATLIVGLWCNMHGSFLIGVFVLAVMRPRWAFLALALTLLNPYGVGLWRLVGDYAFGRGVVGLATTYVDEWRPLFRADPMSATRLGVLLLAGVASLESRQSRRLAFVLVPAALIHMRMAAIAGALLIPWVAEALERRLPDRPFPSPLRLAGAALLLAFLASPNPKPLLGTPSADASLRTWSDLTLGAWLGVHGVAPFWDARNDCYSLTTYADGMRIALRTEGWEGVLSAYGVQQVVTTDGDLAVALKELGWRTSGSTPEVLRSPNLGY